MLPVQGIFMVVALIPVILIEAVVIWRRESISFKRSLGGSAAANAVSTLAGVPLSWGLMFLVLMASSLIDANFSLDMNSPAIMIAYVILNAAWLAPLEQHLSWMAPMALAILMIPSYFMSVWIEYLVCKWIWKDVDTESLWTTMRTMNGVTYAILILVCIVLMLMNFK